MRFSTFARYVILSVLGSLGVSCYILADTFFISRGLGAAGLTALNLAIPAYNLIHGTGLMLGMGGATRFSILKSTSGRANTQTVVFHTVCMALGLGLLFSLTGLCFAKPLARLLGADGQIIGMTSTYLRVLLAFAPAFICNDVLLCLVRNDGSPRLAMSGMLFGSGMNILLDYLFIFPMDMGMLGAVLASGLSPLLSMAVLSFHWLGGRSTIVLRPSAIRPELCSRLLSLGFPSLIDQVSGAVVMIAFNLLILGLEGNTGVAAYGVVANIALVIASLFSGIAQGMQPLVSGAYGRGDTAEHRRILSWGLSTALVLAGVFYGLVCLLAHPIAAIFNRSADLALQNIAVTGLRLYFLSNPFLGCNAALAVWLSSTEQTGPAHTLSLLRGFGLILPLAFGMARVWGMTGIWLAFPAAELLAAVIGFGLQKKKAS